MKKILLIFFVLFTFSFACFANDSDIFNSKTQDINIELNLPFGFLQVPFFNTNFCSDTQKQDFFQTIRNENETQNQNNTQEITPLDLFLFSMKAVYLLSGAPFTNPLSKHYAEAPHEKRQREYQELSY